MESATWFERTFGFQEEKHDYEGVRSKFKIEKNDDGEVTLVAKQRGGKKFFVGKFDLPSVSELRKNTRALKVPEKVKGLTFENIGACARSLHLDPRNKNSVFQVASQFNMLEMVGPRITPDQGVTRYENDHTQGPACALAAPAGTVFRNYFVNKVGQGGEPRKQLNGCADIAKLVDNEGNKFWKMSNGYLLPLRDHSIAEVGKMLVDDARFRDAVVQSLRVGVHWSTEVERQQRGHARRKRSKKPHRVTQVFCSAVPISYCPFDITCPPDDWREFAQAILDGTYEATLAVAATISQQKKRRVTVFLTQVGGGVFGNQMDWIEKAIARAMKLHAHFPLDVKLVHYQSIPRDRKNPFMLLQRFHERKRAMEREFEIARNTPLPESEEDDF